MPTHVISQTATKRGMTAMEMARFFCVAFSLLLYSGCASQKEIAARNTAEDNAKCSGYGFQKGSQNHAVCMMKLDGDRKVAEQQNAEELSNSIKTAANGYSRQATVPKSTVCQVNGGSGRKYYSNGAQVIEQDSPQTITCDTY